MERPSTRPIILFLCALGCILAGVAAGIGWQARRDAASGPASSSGEELYTCGMHPQVIQKGPGICPICHMKLTPLRSSPAAGVESATIDPVVVQNMGLRVAAVTEGSLEKTVRAPGFFREAEPTRHDISLKVSGWVRELHADTEGMHIRKGTVLFEIYSPEVLAAQSELIGARRALAGLPPAADPVIRKDSERLLETARRKLLLWDVAPEDVDMIAEEMRPRETVLFRSPHEGHLVEKLVVEGSAVRPGEKLLRIVDHSLLWLDVQVYERDLPYVFAGQEARARAQTFPGRVFTGPVLLIHPHLHEMTRSATARVNIENSDLLLRPGMYATVELRSRILEKAVLAPREAVIDTGSRAIAFVALEGGRFDPRTVRMGLETEGGLVQILEGLVPGDKVVTSGQFLLDAESRTLEATRKFLDAGRTGGGGR